MRFKFNAVRLCNVLYTERRGHSDAEYYHIEFFFFYFPIGSEISDDDILTSRDLFLYRYIAPDKPNAGKALRPLIKSLKIFSEGTDVVMEYCTLGIRVMLFC